MDDFLVAFEGAASCLIGVEEAASRPRVVVTGKARWALGTGFHAALDWLEFTKHLSPPRDVEPFVDGDNLHLKSG